MTRVPLERLIAHVRPGAAWTLQGDTLDGLWWGGPGDPPTKEELAAALPAVSRIMQEETKAAARMQIIERRGPDQIVAMIRTVLIFARAIYAVLPDAARVRVDQRAVAAADELHGLLDQLDKLEA